MFRLVKLAAYALLGYVLYELIMGISEGGEAAQAPVRGSSRDASKGGGGGGAGGGGARRGRRGGGQTISGGGGGQSVPVGDSSGAEHSERVGRGVVSR